jgi:hypothetical protein
VPDYGPYHLPSQLIELLTSVIPLLNTSKRGVLTFFRSCGVPTAVVADLDERVMHGTINKYEIARTVLAWINKGGDKLRPSRRDVTGQVTEFQDFCQ